MAQHAAISFVVLMELGLNLNGVAPKLSAAPTATAAFLFWPRLVAANLWTGAAAINKHEKGSLMLVIALVQVGIGLWDLESMWNLKWGLPTAFVAWFLALAVAGYLAKKWRLQRLE